MLINTKYGVRHLSFSTNIFPSDNWKQTKEALLSHIENIRNHLCIPDETFGIGLRLSNKTSQELSNNLDERLSFKAWLDQTNCYIFSINGFPYGDFHQGPIKQGVYTPDWSDQRRASYTKDLAELLAFFLPEKVEYGSISTLPLGYAYPQATAPGIGSEAYLHLKDVVFHLYNLQQTQGKTIKLAIKPETNCLLSSVSETKAWYEDSIISPKSLSESAKSWQVTEPKARQIWQNHLGLCLDLCHSSVISEYPESIANLLEGSPLEIVKVQLGACLKLNRINEGNLSKLLEFANDRYLHQTVVKSPWGPRSYPDLNDYIEEPHMVWEDDQEARVHFHMPLHRSPQDPFTTSNDEIPDYLAILARTGNQHYEVETYTSDVLPEGYRDEGAVDQITKELRWAHQQVSEAHKV